MSDIETRGAAPAAERTPITRTGYARLVREREALVTGERAALAARAQRARLFVGGEEGERLARVAAYELSLVDRKIADLDALLATLQVVPEPAAPTSIEIGTAVRVRHADGAEETLRMVGPLEGDPALGYVASTSAAGRALLGKRPGAAVTVGSGADALTLTVVAVRRPPSDDAPAEQVDARLREA